MDLNGLQSDPPAPQACAIYERRPGVSNRLPGLPNHAPRLLILSSKGSAAATASGRIWIREREARTHHASHVVDLNTI
jgi:hypothetical protein